MGNWWERRNIRKYKEEIEEKKNDDLLEDEIEIFKYQRVYYHNRRHGTMKKRNKIIINSSNVELS